MPKANIFPIYFDAEPVTLSTDQASYNAASSHIRLGSGVDVTLNDAVSVGTCINFISTDSTTAPTVTFVTAAGGATKKKLTFVTAYDTATVIWTANGWRVVNRTTTTSIGSV